MLLDTMAKWPLERTKELLQSPLSRRSSTFLLGSKGHHLRRQVHRCSQMFTIQNVTPRLQRESPESNGGDTFAVEPKRWKKREKFPQICRESLVNQGEAP